MHSGNLLQNCPRKHVITSKKKNYENTKDLYLQSKPASLLEPSVLST